MEVQIQHALYENCLFFWTYNWQMSFDIDKCKVMHFGRTNKAYSYSLDGLPLMEVTEGVIISEDRKVLQQCSSVYNKSNGILGVINTTISYACPVIIQNADAEISIKL